MFLLMLFLFAFGFRNGRVIVFAETKNDCSELTQSLTHLSARALHGDVPQAQREVVLAGFRSGKFMILVATDVAARGLDINDVQLVIQVREGSGKVPGMSWRVREGVRYVRGRVREGSGKVLGMSQEGSGKVLGRFGEGSGNVLGLCQSCIPMKTNHL